MRAAKMFFDIIAFEIVLGRVNVYKTKKRSKF